MQRTKDLEVDQEGRQAADSNSSGHCTSRYPWQHELLGAQVMQQVHTHTTSEHTATVIRLACPFAASTSTLPHTESQERTREKATRLTASFTHVVRGHNPAKHEMPDAYVP